MDINNSIIVSRHAAAIEFIALELGMKYFPYAPGRGTLLHSDTTSDTLVRGWIHEVNDDGQAIDEGIPVVSSATAEDVRGKVVYGNLPLLLAAEAAEVWAIEFMYSAPRSQEYTLEDMRNAGAILRAYKVIAI